MYDFIEAMVPNGPYLELFARKNNQRMGWISVGNESIQTLDE
jgi:mRNA (2'-O-methyladenosine-N6-)-methyltransferase